jgi:hypothetical protein
MMVAGESFHQFRYTSVRWLRTVLSTTAAPTTWRKKYTIWSGRDNPLK